jgi:Ca2+-binding EF-hand superfamily protein
MHALIEQKSEQFFPVDQIMQSSFRKGVGSARRDKNKGRTQGLTEEQKQEIREAFDLFDTDGSGKID